MSGRGGGRGGARGARAAVRAGVRRGKAHRGFDPRRIGQLECEAWVTYYRREWIAFLASSIGLTRRMFGLPWPSTLYGAWLVLRANQLWAPYPDNDPEGARAVMERFYRIVARHHHEPFDPARASVLEVRWWRLHREHQHGQPGDEAVSEAAGEQPLIDALSALYAYVYGADETDVRPAAEQRALAMRYSDQWVAAGRDLDSPLIDRERAALVRSYAALLAAVHRP